MKPRNYIAVHAHFRKGGAHGKTRKAQRINDKRQIRREWGV